MKISWGDNVFRCAAACFCISFLTACAGPSLRYKKSLFTCLKDADFDEAAEKIEKNKYTQYGNKNALLYYLDLGLAYHDAKKYDESEKYLAKAEVLYDELLTRSVTRGLGTLLINDLTTEYLSPNYEKVLLNIFRALNYTYRGDTENALVEVRKLSSFLAELRSDSENSVYIDDAFAEYLSALLYCDFGQADDARISLEDSMRAYKRYYYIRTPEFDIPLEFEDTGKGEIVFIHYNGIAPVKISKTFQIAWNNAVFAVSDTRHYHPDENIQQFENALRAGILGSAITVAYPEMADVPFEVKTSAMEIEGKTAPAVLMEDISKIAKSELERKILAQRTRMIARAAIKYALSSEITADIRRKHGKTAGYFAGAITAALTAATEVADTRSWNLLPAEIRMARIRTNEGIYDVKLIFKNKFGRIIDTIVLQNIEVRKNKRTYVGYRTAY